MVSQVQKMVAETYLTNTKNRSERQQHTTVLTAAPRGTAEGTSTLENVICETTLTELLKGVDIEDTSQIGTVGCSQQEEHYEVEDGLQRPGAYCTPFNPP